MYVCCVFLTTTKNVIPNNKTLYKKKTCILHTADSKKKVPGMYTHSMETIYLSLWCTQVNEGTFYIKSPVCNAGLSTYIMQEYRFSLKGL